MHNWAITISQITPWVYNWTIMHVKKISTWIINGPCLPLPCCCLPTGNDLRKQVWILPWPCDVKLYFQAVEHTMNNPLHRTKSPVGILNGLWQWVCISVSMCVLSESEYERPEKKVSGLSCYVSLSRWLLCVGWVKVVCQNSCITFTSEAEREQAPHSQQLWQNPEWQQGGFCFC